MTTELPSISVVVPSFNQGRFLEECLESIVGQHYPRLELIVMDGGSSDGSVDIIQRYGDHIHFWQSQPDGGQSAAINAGVARATGDIVAWLNSDDLYYEEALWTVGHAWARHPGYGLYIGNGSRLTEEDHSVAPFHRRHIALHRRSLREGVDYIQQPSAFFNLQAWRDVGGLDPSLNFCMDWDIFIRISAKWPAVAINEFLSLSREYGDTKTSSGGLVRAAELARMAHRHTNQPLTLGASLYLLETVLIPTLSEHLGPDFRRLVREAQISGEVQMPALSGTDDGFPEAADPGDVTYVPLATGENEPSRGVGAEGLPRITVVTPSFNQAEYLERTLRSLIDQRYPNLELMVFDGGSTDGSVEVIEKYASHLAHWESEKDRGPAHAINKGLMRASGDIVGWLNSDDMLAEGALWNIARTFQADPELDLVYGNALYIDEYDQPILADHGRHKTALYYGSMVPRDHVPAYWGYVHAIPQPATYFRKDLLHRAGLLDESYKFIFDFELFFRFRFHAKIQKIERLLAFYRIHAAAKTSGWHNFLIELYRFSRAWWPAVTEPQFKLTQDDFLNAFMARYWSGRPPSRLAPLHRAFFAVLTTRNWANPEELLHKLQERRRSISPTGASVPPVFLASTQGEPDASARPLRRQSPPRYNVMFCSYFLPRFPGASGGEIRDFHIVRELLRFCKVSFFASYATDAIGQRDYLIEELDAYYDAREIERIAPEALDPAHLTSMESARYRIMDELRRDGWPVIGPKLPRDAERNALFMQANVTRFLNARLTAEKPDFLIVGPQNNAAALFLDRRQSGTRFIFATYDVESVRLRRLRKGLQPLKALGAHLELRRGARFERDYIAHFDGVIAVSELDRQIFIDSYGIEPSRVAVIDNGVDTDYFSFTPREVDGPLVVMFPANFGYPPNHQAALRLARRIMPLIWKTRPDAELWLVGQQPAPEILALSDGRRVFVTGRVDSVLPYFRRSTVMCAPLERGSGTKTKVIEALSAGAPVVCTSLAAEGLNIVDGVHAVIRDTDEGMVAEIVRLFADRPAMEAMARSGRERVEAEYSWDSILPKLEPWLDSLSVLPRVYPPWSGPTVERGSVALESSTFADMIGVGWSHPEPTHIWSIGRESELWLKVNPKALRVRLEISGNPHVPGRQQDLQIFVNDVEVSNLRLPADSRTVVDLNCVGASWRANKANRVTFRVDATASCATDRRDMGLCLWVLEIQ